MRRWRTKHILFGLCLIMSTAFIISHFLYTNKTPDLRSRGEDSFLSDWCRLQRSRVDWEGFLGSCRYRMSWEHREANSVNRTDADMSYISKWNIKTQGEFSRFFIQSVTKDGRLRKTGGDSWRVYIRQGPASLAPAVFDRNDGSYEVFFLALEPGNYSAQVFLDYTLCDGFRDPPEDWFIKGNVQGRGQKHGMLGYIGDDYTKAPLQRGKILQFYVAKSNQKSGYYKYIQPLINGLRTDQTGLSSLSCGIDCPFLWNGFGRWVDRKWKPYVTKENRRSQPDMKPKLETLLVYGDSIAVHYHALAKIRSLCQRSFRRCNVKYMWIYDADWGGRDNHDFNQSIVLEEIKEALAKPEVRGQNSVFLFNIGIHYSISLTFLTYQKLLSSVIELIKQRTGDQARCVWRSSTAIEREYAGKFYGGDNLTEWRFHTSPRVQLFHHYATSAMCMAGIPVLDMYPLTAAWPDGTVRHDHIHYPNDVMEPAVNILEQYLIETLTL